MMRLLEHSSLNNRILESWEVKELEMGVWLSARDITRVIGTSIDKMPTLDNTRLKEIIRAVNTGSVIMGQDPSNGSRSNFKSKIP